jgi:hypothetical protein
MEATTTDKFMTEVKKSITNPAHEPKRADLGRFTFQDKLLFRDNLLYVSNEPCWTKLLQECHDGPLGGHFGVAKTNLELVSRRYWWPQPWKLVKEFIKSFDTCAHTKVAHHRPYGLLQPFSVPKKPWVSLSIDLITNLLVFGGGYDSVFSMVDLFTKMADFAPCAKTISREETIDLFLKNVVRLHGLLEDITSNRGQQFISHFWQHLLQTFRCIVNLSSTYHPQTNGQTKRVNQIMKQYLKCSLSYEQDDWVVLSHLPSLPKTTLCMCLRVLLSFPQATVSTPVLAFLFP